MDVNTDVDGCRFGLLDVGVMCRQINTQINDCGCGYQTHEWEGGNRVCME